jgi:tetratricopeptide (TPR) repeat protein
MADKKKGWLSKLFGKCEKVEAGQGMVLPFKNDDEFRIFSIITGAVSALNEGRKLGAQGNNRGAIECYDKFIPFLEQFMEKALGKKTPEVLAVTYFNKAIAVDNLGDHLGALVFYSKAISILEGILSKEWDTYLAIDMATAYMNKAKIVTNIQNPRWAIPLYDMTISILERLVKVGGQGKLEERLSLARELREEALKMKSDADWMPSWIRP